MGLNVAMIGLSHPHSAMYLETLDTLGEVASVPLCDPDLAVAREAAGGVRKATGVYADVEALLAGAEFSHALVAVPTDRSVPTLTCLIDAGKHVFTEKPAARTAAEFESVVAALARRPVAFGVAYFNRWQPALRQLRDLYRGGALGRLTSVELRMVTTQPRFRDPAHWLFDRERAGGGILSWLGCHWLDLVRHVTGEEITRVAAELAITSGEAIAVEDTAAVAFRLSGGAVGSLHSGYLLTSGAAGYRSAGYDSAVILRGTLGSVTYRRGAEEEPLVLESIAPGWGAASPRTFGFAIPPSPGYGGIAGLDFFRAFLAAGPSDPVPASATDALRVLDILDAAYESGRTGRAAEVVRRSD